MAESNSQYLRHSPSGSPPVQLPGQHPLPLPGYPSSVPPPPQYSTYPPATTTYPMQPPQYQQPYPPHYFPPYPPQAQAVYQPGQPMVPGGAPIAYHAQPVAHAPPPPPPPPANQVLNQSNNFADHFSSLSTTVKVFWAIIAIAWLLIFITRWQVGVFIPALFLPTIFAYEQWRKHYKEHVEFDFFNRLYIIGFAPGALVVLFAEMLLTIVFALICLSDQIDDIKSQLDDMNETGSTGDFKFRRTFGFFAFLFLMGYVVAALTEESLKYFGAMRVKQTRPWFNHINGWIFYAIAPALGFSTMENVGYLFRGGEAQTVAQAGFEALQRVFISTPIHCMTATLIGIGMVKREVYGQQLKWYHIMALPVFIHGTFDFLLFIVMVYGDGMSTTTSFAVSLVVAITILVATAFWIRRELRNIRQIDFVRLRQTDQDLGDNYTDTTISISADDNNNNNTNNNNNNENSNNDESGNYRGVSFHDNNNNNKNTTAVYSTPLSAYAPANTATTALSNINTETNHYQPTTQLSSNVSRNSAPASTTANSTSIELSDFSVI